MVGSLDAASEILAWYTEHWNGMRASYGHGCVVLLNMRYTNKFPDTHGTSVHLVSPYSHLSPLNLIAKAQASKGYSLVFHANLVAVWIYHWEHFVRFLIPIAFYRKTVLL